MKGIIMNSHLGRLISNDFPVGIKLGRESRGGAAWSGLGKKGHRRSGGTPTPRLRQVNYISSFLHWMNHSRVNLNPCDECPIKFTWSICLPDLSFTLLPSKTSYSRRWKLMMAKLKFASKQTPHFWLPYLPSIFSKFLSQPCFSSVSVTAEMNNWSC